MMPGVGAAVVGVGRLEEVRRTEAQRRRVCRVEARCRSRSLVEVVGILTSFFSLDSENSEIGFLIYMVARLV